MDFWRQLKTVMWSFIGLSGRKLGDEHKINPLVVIVMAFVIVALLLGTIAFIAKHAAGT